MKIDEFPSYVYYTYRADLAFMRNMLVAAVAYGVLKVATISNPRLAELPLLGALLFLAYVVIFLNLLSHLRSTRQYAIGAKDRRPYLTFDVAGIKFRDSQINWADVSAVASVEVLSKSIKSPPETHLILILQKEKKANMIRAKDLEELRRDNAWIIRYREGHNLHLRENEFLSLVIASGAGLTAHLSADGEEILSMARRYLFLHNRDQHPA